MSALDQFAPGSVHWAKRTPTGWAEYVTQGRWKPSRHLMVVQRYLMALESGQIQNLIVTMPPRHGKTELVTKALPGHWLGKNPHDEVIITSYEATLALDFGGVVRDNISEFGGIHGLSVKSDKRAAGNWRLQGLDSDGRRVSGGLRATGVGGGIAGRGGDLIIIDDPIKGAKQAQSAVYRKGLWDWYLADLYSRKSPTARQLVVTTRWHDDDLVGRLLENRDETEGQQWAVLNLPAICDSEDDILGRQIGEALWPERWPIEKLLEIKATTTPYWWGALYQGRPSPPEGNIFKRKWWNFWQPQGAKLPPVRIQAGDDEEVVKKPVDLPEGCELYASSWDLSFKKGEGTSYVAGQAWAKKGGNAYLLDQTRKRRDFPETVAAFRAFHILYPYITAKWVEDKANGPALIALLKSEIPGIIPVNPLGSKEDRGRSVAYYPEAGNVFLPHPAIAPWVMEFIENHSAFPNAMWDDEVDTLSQALTKLFDPTEAPSFLWSREARGRTGGVTR